MLNITYTRSAQTNDLFNSIEQTRRTILCTPLSPQYLRRLQFESLVVRLETLSRLFGQPMTKQEIRTLIRSSGSKVKNTTHQFLTNYRFVLMYISENWTAAKKALTWQTVGEISTILAHKTGKQREFGSLPQKDTQQLLAYLDAQEDHPIVSATLMFAVTVETINPYRRLVSLALSSLILAKAGFDVRDLFVPEACFLSIRDLTGTVDAIRETGNCNPMILSVALCANEQLKTIAEMTQKASPVQDNFFHLTDRERLIMTMVDDPESMVTNKKVQKKTDVSQITASRDLSRLTLLGLLIPHGKGRSMYYTKK